MEELDRGYSRLVESWALGAVAGLVSLVGASSLEPRRSVFVARRLAMLLKLLTLALILGELPLVYVASHLDPPFPDKTRFKGFGKWYSFNFGFARPVSAIVALALNLSFTTHYGLRWVCIVLVLGVITCDAFSEVRARARAPRARRGRAEFPRRVSAPRPRDRAALFFRFSSARPLRPEPPPPPPPLGLRAQVDLSHQLDCLERGKCAFGAGYDGSGLYLLWYRDHVSLFLGAWCVAAMAVLHPLLGLDREHYSFRSLERTHNSVAEMKKELRRLGFGELVVGFKEQRRRQAAGARDGAPPSRKQAYFGPGERDLATGAFHA